MAGETLEHAGHGSAQTRLSRGEISRFVNARFGEVRTAGDLVHFHTINKYLFMSYSPRLLGVLGKTVANHEKKPISKVMEDYGLHLGCLLRHIPSTRSHANVLYHILGHFSKSLDGGERRAMTALIDSFRNGGCSLSAVLSVMKEFTARLDKTYLARQTYFLLFLNSRSSA